MGVSKQMMQGLIFIFKLLLTIILVYWLLNSGHLDFSQLLKQPLSLLHVLGIFILVCNFILSGYRWFLLLKIQVPYAKLRNVLGWMWISEFFTLVTPGGGGGEFARSYYAIKNHPNARMAAISSVIIDRLIGFISLLFLGFMAYIIFAVGDQKVAKIVHYLGVLTGGALLTIVLGLAILIAQPTRKLIMRYLSDKMKITLTNIIQTYWNHKIILIHCFLLSLVCHMFLIIPFWVAAVYLNIDMDYLSSMLVVPLTFIANFIPLTPGGIGVGEAASGFMFDIFNVPNGAGLMALVRIWMIILQLFGGFYYLIEKDKNDVSG